MRKQAPGRMKGREEKRDLRKRRGLIRKGVEKEKAKAKAKADECR